MLSGVRNGPEGSGVVSETFKPGMIAQSVLTDVRDPIGDRRSRNSRGLERGSTRDAAWSPTHLVPLVLHPQAEDERQSHHRRDGQIRQSHAIKHHRHPRAETPQITQAELWVVRHKC